MNGALLWQGSEARHQSGEADDWMVQVCLFAESERVRGVHWGWLMWWTMRSWLDLEKSEARRWLVGGEVRVAAWVIVHSWVSLVLKQTGMKDGRRLMGVPWGFVQIDYHFILHRSRPGFSENLTETGLSADVMGWNVVLLGYMIF